MQSVKSPYAFAKVGPLQLVKSFETSVLCLLYHYINADL